MLNLLTRMAAAFAILVALSTPGALAQGSPDTTAPPAAAAASVETAPAPATPAPPPAAATTETVANP